MQTQQDGESSSNRGGGTLVAHAFPSKRCRRFDVVASGSLLGINYKEVPSFPVGYVEHLDMHSLDFEKSRLPCTKR
jgi:hypothetical protein